LHIILYVFHFDPKSFYKKVMMLIMLAASN